MTLRTVEDAGPYKENDNILMSRSRSVHFFVSKNVNNEFLLTRCENRSIMYSEKVFFSFF